MNDSEPNPPAPDNTPPAAEPPVTLPRAPAPSVVCPGCGAKLSNTQSDPGTKIRCLNCGARFTPGVPLDKNEDIAASSKSAGPAEKKTREPRAAGYWLLRIPAIFYAAGASALFVFLIVLGAWSVFDSLRRGNFPIRRYTDIMPILYVPLLPLSAYLFYAIATSLSRIEAGTLKALFKLGLLDDSLPQVPGSSLPYIAPLAVGASCVVAALVALNQDGTSNQFQGSIRNQEGIVFGAILSFAAFLAAFMSEDFRQFFWRQRVMAEAAAQTIPGRKEPVPSTPLSALALFPMLSLFLLGSGIAFQFLISARRDAEVMAMYEKKQTMIKGRPIPSDFLYLNNNGDAETLQAVVSICAVLAATITIYLLGSKCTAAVRSWRVAAQTPGRWALSGSLTSLDLIFVRLSLLAFAFIGGLWFCYQIFIREGYRRNFRIAEMLNLSIVALGCACLCVTVSSVLTHVRDWRLSQERFWRSRFPTLSPRLTWLQRFVIFSGFALASIELCGFAIMMLIEVMRFRGRSVFMDDELVLMGLAAYILHFPIVFTTIITHDLLLIQNGAANAAISSANSATTSSPTAAPHYPANTRTAAPETPASL